MGRPGPYWDETHNPGAGCEHISPGCDFCYEEPRAGTLHIRTGCRLYDGVTDWVRGRPRFNGKLTEASPNDPIWTMPLRWGGARYPKMGDGQRSILFVGTTTDIFHERRDWHFVDRIVGPLVASEHVGLFVSKRAH